MTVYKDNPAGRLYELLDAFKRAEGDRTRFARALKISSVDRPGFLQAFRQVFILPDDIEVEMRQINADNYDPDLALRWQENLVDTLGKTLFWGEKNPAAPDFSEFMSSLEY